MPRLLRSPRTILLLLPFALALAWLARGGPDPLPVAPAAGPEQAPTAAIAPVDHPPLRPPETISLDVFVARLPQEGAPRKPRRVASRPDAPELAELPWLDRTPAPPGAAVPATASLDPAGPPSPRRDPVAWPSVPGITEWRAYDLSTGSPAFDDGRSKIEPRGRPVEAVVLAGSGAIDPPAPASPSALAPRVREPESHPTRTDGVASVAPAIAVIRPLPDRRAPLVWVPPTLRPDLPTGKPGTEVGPAIVDVVRPSVPIRPAPVVRGLPGRTPGIVTPRPLPAPVAPGPKPGPSVAAPVAPAPVGLPSVVQPAPTLGFAPIEIAGFKEVEQLVTGGVVQGDVNVATGGVLGGSGRIAGGLAVAGIFAPGHSPGYVEVEGDFVQGTESVLEIELAGTAPEDFDRIVVEGMAVLSGVIRVLLLDGFVPEVGDTFDVLLAEEILDEGVVFELPQLPPWLLLGPVVVATDEGDILRLITSEGDPETPTVPAPSVAWLLAVGAVSAGLRRRRRTG